MKSLEMKYLKLFVHRIHYFQQQIETMTDPFPLVHCVFHLPKKTTNMHANYREIEYNLNIFWMSWWTLMYTQI